MRILFLALLLLANCNKLLSQTATQNYSCTFIDTFSLHISPEIAEKFSQDLPQLTEKSDSLTRDFKSSPMFRLLGMKFFQVHKKYVKAKPDSTTIEFDEYVEYKGLKRPLPYKKMIILKGREVSKIYGINNELVDLPKNEERRFTASGSSLLIKDYLCEEFISADKTVIIWVTKSLPSYINPGVKNVDVEGAILGYILTNSNQTVVCMLQQIIAHTNK